MDRAQMVSTQWEKTFVCCAASKGVFQCWLEVIISHYNSFIISRDKFSSSGGMSANITGNWQSRRSLRKGSSPTGSRGQHTKNCPVVPHWLPSSPLFRINSAKVHSDNWLSCWPVPAPPALAPALAPVSVALQFVLRQLCGKEICVSMYYSISHSKGSGPRVASSDLK